MLREFLVKDPYQIDVTDIVWTDTAKLLINDCHLYNKKKMLLYYQSNHGPDLCRTMAVSIFFNFIFFC